MAQHKKNQLLFPRKDEMNEEAGMNTFFEQNILTQIFKVERKLCKIFFSQSSEKQTLHMKTKQCPCTQSFF